MKSINLDNFKNCKLWIKTENDDEGNILAIEFNRHAYPYGKLRISVEGTYDYGIPNPLKLEIIRTEETTRYIKQKKTVIYDVDGEEISHTWEEEPEK